MNYIKQVNAFYDWLETNSISTSCIALWHALMAINNRAGWIPEFTVAISTLEIKTDLKKKTIERSRNTLEQKGLIKWTSRNGNQSAIYTIVKLYVNDDPQTVPQEHLRVINDPQPVSQTVPQYVPQPVSINKLNKTKPENTTYSANAFENPHKNHIHTFANECGITGIDNFTLDDLFEFIGKVDIEVIEYALKKARKKHLNYAINTLKSMILEGKTTKESVVIVPEINERRRGNDARPQKSYSRSSNGNTIDLNSLSL